MSLFAKEFGSVLYLSITSRILFIKSLIERVLVDIRFAFNSSEFILTNSMINNRPNKIIDDFIFLALN